MAIKTFILAFVIVILNSFTQVHAHEISTIFNDYKWHNGVKEIINKLPEKVKRTYEEFDRGNNLETWTHWMKFGNGRIFRTGFYFNKHDLLNMVTVFIEPNYKEYLQKYEMLDIFKQLVSLYGNNYSLNKLVDNKLGEYMISWKENSNHGSIVLTMSQFCTRGECTGYSPVAVSYYRPQNMKAS
jgi:hypothetical protein